MFKRAVNRIRDAVYNKSDVFVALIIICLAGALIFWRIDVIMKYPETLVSNLTTNSILN